MTRLGMMVLPGTASVPDLRELGVTTVRTVQRDLLRDGSLDAAAVARFRAAWSPWVEAGFHLHLVTPFPADLPGVDPADRAGRRAWQAIGAGLGEALGDLVGSWQIGNELNLWHFREPLATIREAVPFVAAVGRGLRRTAPGARLGVNAFGSGPDAAELIAALCGPDAAIDLDYIGVDSYPGSWEPGGPSTWRATLDRVWELGHGRPIAVCEVGFASRGEVAASGELAAYLARLGYRDAASVETDRRALLAVAPEPLRRHLERLPAAEWAADFEDSAHHLLRKWPWGWGPGSHTPEKQARYLEETLAILLQDERVEEVLLFMWRDLERCWTCGREDCPLETAWGFVDRAGRRKPAVATIRRIQASAELGRGRP
jgi:hypothetical protein